MSMRIACLFGCAVLALAARPASAQEARPVAEATPVDARTDAPTSHETRLYVGMWTTHLKHRVVTLDNNWLIGFTHRGFFGGTFVNSFGRRAYSAGIQRTAFSTARGRLTTSLGYRLGLVSGYDGRFMRLARDMPVLPLIQAYGNADVGRVGVEVSYTIVVVSVAMSYRFK